MQAKQKQFIKSLCEAVTPTGFELPGQRIVAEYLKGSADTISLDHHGNLHCVLNPGAKRRVMLDAHCDEIGFITQYVDKEGYIFVQALGGVNVQLLPGERVMFLGPQGPVSGVIGRKAIHLMTAKERESTVSDISELWVDIGSKSEAETLEVLPLGSCGIVEAGWRELRNGIVTCRAFDDRAGVFVIAEALRILAERTKEGRGPKVAVHCVSATQEEIGLLGATVAAFGIEPHAGIAVDVTFASDDPGGTPKKTSAIKIGGGPSLAVGPAFDKDLSAVIQTAAKASETAVQIHPHARGNGTDAYAIRHSRAGVPVALLSIPLRYMHSAVELLSLDDLEKTATLIADTVAALPEDFSFGPKL